MEDQRLAYRTNIMARAEATWIDSFGNNRPLIGMLENTSPHRSCLLASEPIEVGSRVAIKWWREEFLATVRHRKRKESEYLVGIQRDGAASTRRPV